MTNDQRKRHLDQIRKQSEKLNNVAKGFDRLRWMAEEDASEAFIALAIAAGEMTNSALDQTATLLELLWRAGKKIGDD